MAMPIPALLGGPPAIPSNPYAVNTPTRYYIIEWRPQDIGIPVKYLDAFGIALSKALGAEGVLIDYIGEGCSIFPAPPSHLVAAYAEAFDKVLAWVESHAVAEAAYLGSIGEWCQDDP